MKMVFYVHRGEMMISRRLYVGDWKSWKTKLIRYVEDEQRFTIY
jgi:hypothetical protein